MAQLSSERSKRANDESRELEQKSKDGVAVASIDNEKPPMRDTVGCIRG
jgi:hypothetical protein